MVKVIFYNLLRSKYKVSEASVKSGSITNIISQILDRYKEMSESDFASSIVFYNGIVVSHYQFDKVINDGEEIIITHFVGGG